MKALCSFHEFTMLYKFSPRLFVIAILTLASPWATVVTGQQMYVVTSANSLPAYYAGLQYQNHHGNVSDLTPQMKDAICRRAHNFFGGTFIEPEAHESVLKQNYRLIFADLFEKIEPPHRQTELSSPDDGEQQAQQQAHISDDEDAFSDLTELSSGAPRYRYANRSKLRHFRTCEEVTFACLYQSYGGEIRSYYMSDFGYNVNDAAGQEPMEGRFIFFNNQLAALAEEQPAEIMRDLYEPANESGYYADRHFGHSPVANPGDDPICRLDGGRKLRLCTYICMRLVPGCAATVEPAAVCRRFGFLLGSEWYNEWSLECVVTIGRVEVSRYVARGYSDNEVFVFSINIRGAVAGRFSLGQVSVVTDP